MTQIHFVNRAVFNVKTDFSQQKRNIHLSSFVHHCRGARVWGFRAGPREVPSKLESRWSACQSLSPSSCVATSTQIQIQLLTNHLTLYKRGILAAEVADSSRPFSLHPALRVCVWGSVCIFLTILFPFSFRPPQVLKSTKPS